MLDPRDARSAGGRSPGRLRPAIPGATTVYTAAWVAPVCAPPIRDGAVAVERAAGEAPGRVTWVGRATDPARPAGDVQDLGEGVLLPGLVNAHCHLELSHLHGLIDPDGGLVDWVRRLVAAREAEGPARVRAAASAAVESLVATGTVAVGDVSNQPDHLDLLAAAGLRATVFLEVLGWDPARAGWALGHAREQAGGLEKEAGPGVRVRLAAHAPYSVSAPLLRAMAEGGDLAAIHLAEGPDETALLADGSGAWPAFLTERAGPVPFTPPRRSPVAYLDELGALGPHLLAAHCVQVDEADRRLLADRRVNVVLCPRSNAFLGVGMADVPALLAAGVRLALGTDSLASNHSLSLAAEMALLHQVFPEIAPRDIVHMATRGGALALGLPDLGEIAPGRTAALAFAAGSCPDPLAFLVSGEARPVPPPGQRLAAGAA